MGREDSVNTPKAHFSTNSWQNNAAQNHQDRMAEAISSLSS
jgi:hypothetical protein